MFASSPFASRAGGSERHYTRRVKPFPQKKPPANRHRPDYRGTVEATRRIFDSALILHLCCHRPKSAAAHPTPTVPHRPLFNPRFLPHLKKPDRLAAAVSPKLQRPSVHLFSRSAPNKVSCTMPARNTAAGIGCSYQHHPCRHQESRATPSEPPVPTPRHEKRRQYRHSRLPPARLRARQSATSAGGRLLSSDSVSRHSASLEAGRFPWAGLAAGQQSPRHFARPRPSGRGPPRCSIYHTPHLGGHRGERCRGLCWP
jgi:hypothetical protein